MSAKGRGREVEENEFYPTDPECVWSLFESDALTLPGGTWIEPCAGTGAIISAVNAVRNDVSWIACDINRNFKPYLQKVLRPQDHLEAFTDFVHRRWDWPMADVLIMNPPFSFTMDFVRTGLKRARIVVCLPPHAWFGSVGPAQWLEAHCPDSFQLPWRPSFRPDGKTDNCDYCWYHWPEGSVDGRESGTLRMLKKPQGQQMDLF